jgi:hypothetical protein
MRTCSVIGKPRRIEVRIASVRGDNGTEYLLNMGYRYANPLSVKIVSWSSSAVIYMVKYIFRRIS